MTTSDDDDDDDDNNPWRYSSDEPWPAEQPPLVVFLDCTRRYWVDMWSAHRIPQLHFQLSKPETVIKPCVIYGAELWTVTKKDEDTLATWERKILRRIYGPKYINNEWKP
jgi:hypothetical protein